MSKKEQSLSDDHNPFKISYDYHQMVAKIMKSRYNYATGGKPNMIAIDIHDTLGDYILAMCQRYGPPKTWPTDGLRTLDGMWPAVDMTAHFDPSNHGPFLSIVPHFFDAPNAVWRLRQMGLTFCYFTATPEKYRDVMVDWLELRLFPPAEMRMAESWTQKAEALAEMDDISMIIEDSPTTLLAAADLGISCYVFDRPWNRDVTVGTRVCGWTHLLWQITRDLSLYGMKQEKAT